MDDDKVSVSIREIENGYMVSRSWHEKPKKGKDFGDYKSEEFFMKTLPGTLKQMFSKKGLKDMSKKKDDSFESATAKAMKEME